MKRRAIRWEFLHSLKPTTHSLAMAGLIDLRAPPPAVTTRPWVRPIVFTRAEMDAAAAAGWVETRPHAAPVMLPHPEPWPFVVFYEAKC